MAATTWAKDDVQFPRLIAELWGVGLTRKQIDDLCATMDLKPSDLTELFERADAAWQKIKDATPVPDAAPQMRCRDCDHEDDESLFFNIEEPNEKVCPKCGSDAIYLIPADAVMVRTAKRMVGREGELEVDDNAIVSRGNDHGAYVAAWVWIDDEDVTDADRKGDD